MTARRRTPRRPRPRPPVPARYTIDASVFVNAFNPHENGHAASLAIIAAIQERGDPVIVPALFVTEVAAAVARSTDDSEGATAYAKAAAALPHLTLVSLTPAVARQAADLAAAHRLRGADAIYLMIARRYGAALVTRDAEQRRRGGEVVPCRTPEEALEA